MGSSNSLPQTETINWKNIKTDQISSTIPNLNGISFEANKLIEKLNVPEVSDSSSEINTNFFLKKKISNNLSDNNLSDAKISSTTPFISSDMYNFIMDKYKNQNMIGGGENNDLNEDSSTTSTSSSDKSVSPIKNEKSNKKKKVNKKSTEDFMLSSAKNKKKINKKSTDDFMDYMSSSAHTGGNITESSIANENDNNLSYSSVRTSQLNLVSS